MQDRILAMIENWETEKRAFSHINNNDSEFFEKTGLEYDKIGITSQTGNDIVYYDTNVYSDPIRKIPA